MKSRPLFLLAMLPLLLVCLPLATSANSLGTFNARITITSQCATQGPLFGPQAINSAPVVCQPGTTPFQTESFYLDSDGNLRKKDGAGAGTAQQNENQGSGVGVGTPAPSAQSVLSPPLPSASTFASKVLYVIF